MRSFTFPIQLRACLFALLGLISRLLSVSIGSDIRCANCRRLVPPVLWMLFICVCFPSISYASSPPTNDVHICEVLDYEDIRARDSLYVATKQALDLDVGEPRTVRMIYFLPNDRPFQQAVVDSMKVTIRQIQTFYADQMEAHGYGRKTFRFETDAQGDPVVHRVDGKYPDSYYYDDTVDTVFGEFGQAFDVRQNIYFIAIDKSINRIGQGRGRTVAGVGGRRGKSGGTLLVSAFGWTLVAHELGHAFGLWHDFRNGNYIMSYGGSRRDRLSACHAEYLSVHPYFDSDIPDEETSGPTIELISSPEYSASSTSVPVQLRVSDPDGLHQVTLFVNSRGGFAGGASEVKACRSLSGEKDALVEFDYDGVVQSDVNYERSHGISSLSDPLVHSITIEAVDTGGNTDEVFFSLWDVAIRRNAIAILEEDDTAYFLSFSPDGKTLAANRGVWDIATQTEIIPLGSSFVTFSPDGTIIAAANNDHKSKIYKVTLWDIATRRNIATFEGHTGSIRSLAFSPDRTILASGSFDGTIKLWDIPSKDNIATIKVKNKRNGRVSSVAFSPDGLILASGQRNEISPGRVKLWDVATRRDIATFEHLSGITSVAFSPDGTILASGSDDGTILLWDVSAIIPWPQTLVKVSGDKQQGVLSAPLENPLIVEVKDQNGNVLEGVVVTFSVIEGEGTLSVKTATTDSSGRVQAVLTLGNSLGTTIVAVTVAGIEQPATFVIKAIDTPDFDGDGTVGFPDFLLFVVQFGLSRENEAYQVRFDLDGDGMIGFSDFLIFANNFGKKVSS